MHRAIPVSNRFLDEKWNKLQHERLRQRILNSRGVMASTSIPGSRGSPIPSGTLNALSPIRVVINRAKRDQIQEDRYTEIEKENRRLLERMTAMLKKKKQNNIFTRQTNMDASTMTSEQISKIFSASIQMSPRDTNSPLGFKKSLNREYRKRELQRISEENQSLLQRLQFARPQIESKKMEELYKKKIPTLRNMCQFPYILGQPSKDKKSFFSTVSSPEHKSISLNHYSQVSVVQQWCNQSQACSDRNSLEGKVMSPVSVTNSPRNVCMFARPSVQSTIKSPINVDTRQAAGLDQNRVVHFKKGKFISNAGYFIIEISTSTTNLFIAAFDVESPASFLITIPFPKAQDVVEMFQHNFELMSEFLSFSRRKLVMLNPSVIQRRMVQQSNNNQEQYLNSPETTNSDAAFDSERFISKRAQTTSNCSSDPNSGQPLNQRYQNMQQFKTTPWSQNNQRTRVEQKIDIYSDEGTVGRGQNPIHTSAPIEVRDQLSEEVTQNLGMRSKNTVDEGRIRIRDQEAMTTTDMCLNSSMPESIAALEQKAVPLKIESDQDIN